MHDTIATATPLGVFYLVACALNVGAALVCFRGNRTGRLALVWLGAAAGFLVLAICSLAGAPLAMPEWLKTRIDAALGPVTLTLGSAVVLASLYLGRPFFVRPIVAFAALDGSLVFLGASLTDPEFAGVVTQPDNVPIVAMVYLLAFFGWLGAHRAVENDARMLRGAKPREAGLRETVLVWPDLVYIELIAMVVLTTLLIAWSLALRAPLEQPANPVLTPNPSKAPWYFLGLQEMLVFFDPSIAGVILPALIILGLMAIPYLDFNHDASGYYTIEKRKFSYVVFHFGFLQLWILLILVGTFMRGPNWNFFGLYEFRDPYKVPALGNVALSEYFWSVWLGVSVPQPSPGSGIFAQLSTILWREIAGVLVLGCYFVLLPIGLGRTVLRHFREEMGAGRYTLMTLLLLMMCMLPLKMMLRWTANLSYLVSVPEFFFNF